MIGVDDNMRIEIVGTFPGVNNAGLLAIARRFYRGARKMRIVLSMEPMAALGFHSVKGGAHLVELSIIQSVAEIDVARHMVWALIHEIRHAQQADKRRRWYDSWGYGKRDEQPTNADTREFFSPVEFDARLYQNTRFGRAWDLYQATRAKAA